VKFVHPTVPRAYRQISRFVKRVFTTVFEYSFPKLKIENLSVCKRKLLGFKLHLNLVNICFTFIRIVNVFKYGTSVTQRNLFVFLS